MYLTKNHQISELHSIYKKAELSADNPTTYVIYGNVEMVSLLTHEAGPNHLHMHT